MVRPSGGNCGILRVVTGETFTVGVELDDAASMEKELVGVATAGRLSGAP